MSGNFENCQGKIEYLKMSWKIICVREKLNFQVYTQRASSSHFFLFFSIKIYMLL